MILAHAYIRRKRWEADATAAAVINALAQGMGGETAANSDVITPNSGSQAAKYITLKDGRRARVVPPEAFLQIVSQR